jgi:hypothetical protein
VVVEDGRNVPSGGSRAWSKRNTRTLRPCNRRAIPPCARRATGSEWRWLFWNAPRRCARDCARGERGSDLLESRNRFSAGASKFVDSSPREKGKAFRSGVERSWLPRAFPYGRHFPPRLRRPRPISQMTHALVVKPRAQRHEWNLYLNAAMFTSTTMLDEVAFVAKGEATVREMVEQIRVETGRGNQTRPRRVDGFEEKWTKVLFRGQELCQDMSWDDVGVFANATADEDKKVVVTVVWKEIAAEGYKVATDAMDDVSTDEDENGDEFDYCY